jgi:3-oxoacyl-[acyl-carrier protein] reductase
MDFTGQTVVVTGGSRGIGRAITLAFAGAGAQVFAAYLQNDAAAAQLQVDGADCSGMITPVRADVSTSAGATALLDAATAVSGSLDVLVNNAGIIRDGYLAMMADADWEAVLQTNLSPLFHCCKWGVRKMMANRKGVIINLSSIAGITGTAGQTNYAASKGAIISFSKALAREVGSLGIRVNTVAPGMIDTEMVAGLKPELVDRVVKGSALGRIGRPEEVAAAVLFLASAQASYISGQTLVVDGGIV